MTTPLPLELQSKPRAVPRGVPGAALANLFLVMFSLIGGGFAVAAYVVSSDMDAGSGAAAGTATIERVEEIHIGKKTKKAEITFRYGDAHASCRVRWSDGAGLHPGDEQPYWVVDGSPLVETCVKDTRRTATGMVIGFAIAGTLEFSLGLILSTVFRRRARLYREGDAAAGTITAVKKWGRGLVISYEVTLPVEVRGRSFLDYRRVSGQYRERAPEPGTTVFVVYDPDKPSRSAAWGLP